MADITKCEGNRCAIRGRCYRYLAISNGEYQSYSEWDGSKGVKCDGFWKVKKIYDKMKKKTNNKLTKVIRVKDYARSVEEYRGGSNANR